LTRHTPANQVPQTPQFAGTSPDENPEKAQGEPFLWKGCRKKTGLGFAGAISLLTPLTVAVQQISLSRAFFASAEPPAQTDF
jgi:hypothetical protein